MNLFLLTRLAAADPYAVESSRSSVVARVEVEGIASSLAHDHVVRGANPSGTIVFDPGAPQEIRVEIIVDASQLVADEEDLRRGYGLDKVISAQSRARVQETVEDKLEPERYPEIRFVSERAIPEGGDAYTLEGTLTLHGETRRLSVPAMVRLESGALALHAGFTIFQTSYGIGPYSVAFGAIRAEDVVRIDVAIHAAPIGPAVAEP